MAMSDTSQVLKRCKGCGPQYEVTEEQIDRILQSPMFLDHHVAVTEVIYRERLAQCEQCEHLYQMQTCLLCGCYVRVAAKYRAKSCPNVKNKRWSALT